MKIEIIKTILFRSEEHQSKINNILESLQPLDGVSPKIEHLITSGFISSSNGSGEEPTLVTIITY